MFREKKKEANIDAELFELCFVRFNVKIVCSRWLFQVELDIKASV